MFGDLASAALGGAMIGAAATLLMLIDGRIAGVSGIVAGVLAPTRIEPWRLAFIAGLVAAPVACAVVSGGLPPVEFPHALPLVVIGGALVGFGARFGSGCTSGHGVCGIARLSKRSLAATAIFMTTAILVVTALRLARQG
jgi:hypothetical protein